MASLTSATVAISNFSGLKASAATATRSSNLSTLPVQKTKSMVVRASLRDIGTAVVATAATAIFATSVMAAEIGVLLGGDQGELAFVPSTVEAKAGDTIVFKNNTGFPHNVVFDEDEVPAGVDVAKISMDEEALLNAPGETYKVVLKEPGSYSVYCAPHQGAGMVGKVVIS